MESVKKVAKLLKKSFQTDQIQVIVAGQLVPHTHVHLLPRTKGDGYPEIPVSAIPQPSKEEMKAIQEKIVASLERAIGD